MKVVLSCAEGCLSEGRIGSRFDQGEERLVHSLKSRREGTAPAKQAIKALALTGLAMVAGGSTMSSMASGGPLFGMLALGLSVLPLGCAQQMIGGEFQINNYTMDSQDNPSAVTFSDGNFVVVWQSFDQDGSDWGVYGQLFHKNTTKLGREFRVNTQTANAQNPGRNRQSVARFNNDQFVVVWHALQSGADWDVYGQLYANGGNMIGGEFRINTYRVDLQSQPAVAVHPNDNFVVAWNSRYQDGSDYGIYPERRKTRSFRAGMKGAKS